MADRRRNSLLTIATVLLIFTSAGKGSFEECVTSLRNTVVYEGTPNTVLSCPSGLNGSAWGVRSASDASKTYQITKFNDVVASNFTGLYAYNQSGLIVLNATTTPTGGPISTAGIYIVEFPNKTAAKLVVIRSGPNCTCVQLASDAVNISCNIVYADHPVAPIKEIINCTANGQTYTLKTPIRTAIKFNSTSTNSESTYYVFNSTSTITINNTVPTTYDCNLTFAAPNPATPVYVAKNVPDFSFSFTVCEGPTTTAPSTTTAQSPTTTTPPKTTTTLPTTTTKPPTTTTTLPTTTTKPPTTTTTLPTTTTKPPTTTTTLPTATTKPPTTTTTLPTTTINPPTTNTTLPTATTPPQTTTIVPPTTTTTPPTTTTAPFSITTPPSTATTTTLPPITATATTTAPSVTTTRPTTTTQQPTGASDVGLLATLITLGTILGILLAVTAAVGCSWCFFDCCPPLLPFRRPTRYIDNEIQIFPRREWIPARRDIFLTEYWNIPFYRQSFSRCRTPCEYSLPKRHPTIYEYRLPSRWSYA